MIMDYNVYFMNEETVYNGEKEDWSEYEEI